MDDYLQKLEKAIEQQHFTSTYDLHIRSPLLEQSYLPRQNKDEVKNTNLSIRVPPWIRNALEEIAAQEDIKMSNLITNAINNAIMKHLDTEEARKIYLEKVMQERLSLDERLTPNEGIKAIFQELRELNNGKE